MVPLNRPAQRPSGLIAIVFPSRNMIEVIEVVVGVQFLIAEELERGPVELVGAGFGDDIHQASAVMPVFSVEDVRQQPKLGNRVEVGNHRRAVVDLLLHQTAVHHEPVRVLALAPDGEVPAWQVAGDPAALASARRNAGLKPEQIDVTASVERLGGHRVGVDHIAHLRADGLDANRGE